MQLFKDRPDSLLVKGIQSGSIGHTTNTLEVVLSRISPFQPVVHGDGEVFCKIEDRS